MIDDALNNYTHVVYICKGKHTNPVCFFRITLSLFEVITSLKN